MEDKDKKIESKVDLKIKSPKIPRSAISYDRDKNKSYFANDEAVDEVVSKNGYQVIHPNREIKIKK